MYIPRSAYILVYSVYSFSLLFLSLPSSFMLHTYMPRGGAGCCRSSNQGLSRDESGTNRGHLDRLGAWWTHYDSYERTRLYV
jgi:hypothetical protein